MPDVKIRKLTDAQIEARHRALWGEAIEKHGSANLVPKHVANDISEEIRGLYVLSLWDGNGSPHSLLRSYAVLPDVIARLAGESKVEQKIEKRKDKYAKLIAHARDNTFREFTVAQLMEVSGLSNSTIISWARSTGWYRPSGERGMWEARNPADDRRAEG